MGSSAEGCLEIQADSPPLHSVGDWSRWRTVLDVATTGVERLPAHCLGLYGAFGCFVVDVVGNRHPIRIATP